MQECLDEREHQERADRKGRPIFQAKEHLALSNHADEDWGVVLQSAPSKSKKEIVKRLEEIFELDKQDAEKALSNMPLILLDNISFGLAARVKAHFQKIGAVAIKPSVYAMPLFEHSLEDLSWTLKEIMAGGGDGSIFEASFVEGLSDEQIISLFQNIMLFLLQITLA